LAAVLSAAEKALSTHNTSRLEQTSRSTNELDGQTAEATFNFDRNRSHPLYFGSKISDFRFTSSSDGGVSVIFASPS
jgi:hypothetical protein